MTKELEAIDALIIAGDIADNPASSWPAFSKVLGDLIDLRKVAIFPGNHDYHGWDTWTMTAWSILFAATSRKLGSAAISMVGATRRSG